MTETQWSVVRPLLVESCEGLLEAQGAAPSAWSETPEVHGDQLRVVACIGFAGAEARGGLLLAASLSLLRRLHPLTPHGVDLTEMQLSDWAGEMANQVLGRLKARIAPGGLGFELATPVAMVGSGLRMAGQYVRGRALSVDLGGEELLVQLQCDLPPELVLTPPPPEAASEGELFFL